jgi:hypothetical protein
VQLLDLPENPVLPSQRADGQAEGENHERVMLRIFHAAANANARRLQIDALCQLLEVSHTVLFLSFFWLEKLTRLIKNLTLRKKISFLLLLIYIRSFAITVLTRVRAGAPHIVFAPRIFAPCSAKPMPSRRNN